jgi:hypothetical protein
MTAEWIADLQAEIREMVREAVRKSPYGFVVAVEQDQDQEKGIADRGGNHERQTDDPWT